jgi:hypothetical protein
VNWGCILLIFAGVIGWLGIVPPEIAIVIVMGWSAFNFIKAQGNDLPILEVTAFVYTLQLLITPWISYLSPPDYDRYVMAVPATVYFSFAIPAVCAFLIPISIARQRTPMMTQVMDFHAGPKVFMAGVLLCCLGLGFTLIGPFVPTSVRFVTHLGGDLKFVGALYCYVSRHRQSRWLLAVVLGVTAALSMAEAMFHQLIIWGTIIFSLVLAREMQGMRASLRTGLFVVGLMVLVVLESFKGSYRDALDRDPNKSVLKAMQTTLSSQSLDGEKIMFVLRVRLNQSWIVAHVMNHMPARVGFLEGETFWAAFQDAFIPRSIMSKSTRAGGRDNFRRMTGLNVSDNTSMGVSTIGEAYANFGVEGGIVAMFGFGVFYSGSYYLLCSRSRRQVLFLLWLPLIFSQAVKAETELAVVLNHLVKAAMFSMVMYPVLHQMLFGNRRAESERGISIAPLIAKPSPVRMGSN